MIVLFTAHSYMNAFVLLHVADIKIRAISAETAVFSAWSENP